MAMNLLLKILFAGMQAERYTYLFIKQYVGKL